MMMLSKEQLADKLNGNQYGDEISGDLEREARESRLVVVFGASDDLMEFRGAIDDEAGAFNGAKKTIVDGELFQPCEEGCKYSMQAYERGKSITGLWGKEDPYSWTFATDIPHATFDIFEDEQVYCRGIVFALADV